MKTYLDAGGVMAFKASARAKALDGLNAWGCRHRGHADVVRQELMAEKGLHVKRLVGILSLADLALAEGGRAAGEALAGVSQPGGEHSQTGGQRS